MFFDQLDKLCRQNGTTPTALITSLGMGNSNVTRWKNGTMPNSEIVIKLANYFKVTTDFLLLGIENLPPSLRGDEKRLLNLYNEMDDSGRRFAMVEMFRILQKRKENAEWWEAHEDKVVELMEKSFGPNWRETPSNGGDAGKPIPWEDTLDDFERDDTPYPVYKSLPRYLVRPSAGTGAFLDFSDYELIDLPVDKVPIQTTFCVSISGDSMRPDFEDDDILFVKQQPTIEDGELGIFLYNGDAYFKQYLEEGDQPCLSSYNPIYEPIMIRESDEVRVIGKVIGKYEEQPQAKSAYKFSESPPENVEDFPAWFDEMSRRLNEGIPLNDDEDDVKPGDPEYDQHIPWAASSGAQLDPEKDASMQKSLRRFEKRARQVGELDKKYREEKAKKKPK